MGLPNFGQMKDLYQLQKKAKQMQKELKSLEIEARATDGSVTAVVSGEMKLLEIDINTEFLNEDKKVLLQKNIIETVNQAMTKAQSESASRMQPLLKDMNMNIPGM